MDRETLKRLIATHATKVGDCVIWNGGRKNGVPHVSIITAEGYKYINVRAEIVREKAGYPEGRRVFTACECGNPMCVAWDHVKECRKKATARRRTTVLYTPSNSMLTNKRVFAMAVCCSVRHIAQTLGLHHLTVHYILKNEAMFPYFQIQLQNYTGYKLSDLRTMTYRERKLSLFAKRFIAYAGDYTVYDEDLYTKLLAHCAVKRSHLIWRGARMNNIPCVQMAHGKFRRAVSVFLNAAFNYSLDYVPDTTNAFEDDVNPFNFR